MSMPDAPATPPAAPPPTPPAALVAVADLFHLPRVEAAVRAAGMTPALVMRAADLERALVDPPRLAVIDLAHRGLDPLVLIRDLRAAAAGSGRRISIAAFGSHVQAERLRAAREAGADDVFPNSALMSDLAGRLRALAAAD